MAEHETTPGSEVGEAAPDTDVGDVAPTAATAGHDDRETVPMWLAVLVLALLLAVMVVGGWLLRGAVSGDTPTDPVAIEIGRWEEEVRAKPDDMQAQLQLAFAYQKGQRYREALERYDIVLASFPNDTAAHYNKGIVYRELGLDDEAEKSFWDVLEISPAHELAASALGELYAERGHYQSIIVAVRPAVEAKPQAADLQYLMGLAYENTGRDDWAEARYRLALEYVPDLQDAKDGLERLGATP